jgi:hypothetical protein
VLCPWRAGPLADSPGALIEMEHRGRGVVLAGMMLYHSILWACWALGRAGRPGGLVEPVGDAAGSKGPSLAALKGGGSLCVVVLTDITGEGGWLWEPSQIQRIL